MEKFTVHVGRAVPLRRTDVDTDQIAPARFLTMTAKSGYGEILFYDWKEDPGFVLNDPRYAGGTILVAGKDYATGSSREYAVWAMIDYGFRAVIAPRFGDIFRLNALKNGLVPAIVSDATVRALWELLETDPSTPVTVDLVERQVRAGNVCESFPIDDYTRHRLMKGLDETALTLTRGEAIKAYESRRRQTLPTTVRRA